jgi:hypothetical protein
VTPAGFGSLGVEGVLCLAAWPSCRFGALPSCFGPAEESASLDEEIRWDTPCIHTVPLGFVSRRLCSTANGDVVVPVVAKPNPPVRCARAGLRYVDYKWLP